MSAYPSECFLYHLLRHCMVLDVCKSNVFEGVEYLLAGFCVRLMLRVVTEQWRKVDDRDSHCLISE